MPTREELKMLQALPLSLKVRRSKQRIREWVAYYGADGVYVSFSGGKDSTVLLHLVRELYPEVPAVFVNTGLEYPEIQSFARSFENVVTLRPEMAFPEVIKKYGYPLISKDIAQSISEARSGREYALSKFDPDSAYCRRYPGWGLYKYRPLLTVSFAISAYCCDVMKKKPLKKYERQERRWPILGIMADESAVRFRSWERNGCNAFLSKRPKSRPLSFWTENDVLAYIKAERLPICSVYGDVVVAGDDGFQYDSVLGGPCKYKTTGCNRTGCIFCGFGAHLEKGEGRFERLKRTHPRQYDYCMSGGAYDEDGIWKPTKEGLGMAHVIDELCRIYGPGFIKY